MCILYVKVYRSGFSFTVSPSTPLQKANKTEFSFWVHGFLQQINPYSNMKNRQENNETVSNELFSVLTLRKKGA